MGAADSSEDARDENPRQSKMTPSILVVDSFLPLEQAEAVRASAIESGFGTWKPNKGRVGSSVYEGMNFWGQHSFLVHSLSHAVRAQVFPNAMFFRVTNEATERAYVHSDRSHGSNTAIVYLSEHCSKFKSGTGFFRHRKTGMTEMPTFEQQVELGIDKALAKDMVRGTAKEWEQTDFVRGIFNRALIFHAPLFHSRWPKHGIGTTSAQGRLVWVCHFEVAAAAA